MNFIPDNKSKPFFSLYYEKDGYDIKGKRIMGRQAAGWSFLKSIVQSQKYSRLGFYLKGAEQQKLLKDDVLTLLNNNNKSIELEYLSHSNVDLIESYGGIMLPGPDLTEFANSRAFYGHNRYSLCGITHTTASHSVMSSISNLLTSPIMPWDALICTSNSVLQTVNRILEAQSHFLSYRYNKKLDFLPQLPIIPLGINIDEFHFDDEYKSNSRKELNIEEEDIVIVFVGRLSFHAKAHHVPMYTALEACAKELSGKRKIHLIQTGWFANETLENTFKTESKKICPSVNCIFLDGTNQENKRRTLASGNIFMSLSDNIQETFGLTPLEGMASGLPVIVSDWNGYRSTVRDKVDGFRIKTYALPSGYGEELAFDYMIGKISYDYYIAHSVQKTAIDVKDCIEKLKILIFDESKREEFSNNGKERALNDFSWNKILNNYEELYNELNDIRVNQSDKYKAMCKPYLPSDRLDPFYIFEEYPSEVLHADLKFKKTQNIQKSSINEVVNMESVNYSKNNLPNIEFIEDILSQLNINKYYSIKDLSNIKIYDEIELFKTIIFLLKYGFITTIDSK